MIELSCSFCGTGFTAHPSHARQGRRFCSPICWRKTIPRLTLEQSFRSYFKATQADECWEWNGARLKSGGYGVVWNGETKRLIRAHRLSYTLNVGPIPKDKIVCHHCDNPPCVNPRHLFLGTHADNAADKTRKGRNGTPGAPGEANGSAILTCEMVRVIRSLQGTTAEIARRFKVSESTIRNVRFQKTWRHV